MYLWSFIFVNIKCQVISIINWVFEIEIMKLINYSSHHTFTIIQNSDLQCYSKNQAYYYEPIKKQNESIHTDK